MYQQIGGIKSTMECLSLEESAYSFTAFDPTNNLCTIGSVDLAYSGPQMANIVLYHRKGLELMISYILSQPSSSKFVLFLN